MAREIIKPQYTFKDSMRLLRRILAYFKPYKLKIFFAVVAMIVVALTSAALAYLVQPALDKIFIEKDHNALLWLPPLLVLVQLLNGVARFVQNFLLEYCGLHVLEELRDELYNKIIYLPLKFFEDNQVGMLMSRIINDVMQIRTSLPSIIVIMREMATCIGLIGLVIYRDPFLAAIGLLALPLAFFPFIYFGRRLRKIGRRSQQTIADISIFLNEIFSGIRVLKAFSTEEKETVRFSAENKRLVEQAIKQAKYSQLSSPIMELIGILAAAIIVWYGGKQVMEGVSTPGTFFSFLAAMIMLYEPVKKITSANNEIQRALASAERVFEVLDSPEINVEKEGGNILKEPFKELEFRNVTFAYNPEDQPALRNVSFRLKAGERIAIVGPSGAGKSTFVNLIPRFYEHQEGEILINGLPVCEYTLASLRKNISLVSQDTFLFNTSIMENIGYGLGELNEERVYE
ncbi:MAG: ATP-binding cassette domain-containing protein, partial [Desulfovibrionaceae bacterium]|nr:ATP-binding cassette domain-containing protein [Desulfovibrionaceae bacterium]